MRASYWPSRPISHPKWRFQSLPLDMWEEAKGPNLYMASVPLMQLPGIAECLEKGRAYIGRRHGLRSISIGKARIVGPDVWAGGVEGANATIEHCGVGGYATPGALGRAVLREHYPARPVPPIMAPGSMLRHDLAEGLVGGRCDLIQPDYKGELWDADINMAYPDALREIPWGSPVRLTSSEEWTEGPSYRWWSCYPAEHVSPLGPLASRVMGLLSYPTTYACIGHFWSDEIHRAEENGFACAPGPGWGWFGTSDVLAAGAERLWELREGARFDRYRDLPWRVAIEDNIKRAAVEAIGLWAVSDELVKLGGNDGEEYIDENAGRSGILESRERSSGSLLHLASWVFMRCRCALYDAALPAARRGALVATNFDEIYTTAEPDWLETGTGLGQWKVRKLTNAQAPKPRWIDSDQKTRHPGEAHATI